MQLIQRKKGESEAALRALGPEASELKERNILESVRKDVHDNLKREPAGLLVRCVCFLFFK